MPDFDFHVLTSEAEPYAVSPTLLFQLSILNKIPDEVVLSVNLLTEFYLNSPARSLYWTSVATVVPRFLGATKTTVRLPCSQDSDLQVRKYLGTIGSSRVKGSIVTIHLICKKCRSEKRSRVPRERQIVERRRLMEGRCEVCGGLEYEVDERELEVQTEPTASEEPRIPFKLVFYGSAIYQARDLNTFNFFPFPQLPPKEATFTLRSSIWERMMEDHYGQVRWVSIKEGTFERLHRFVEKNRLAGFDDALNALLGQDAQA